MRGDLSEPALIWTGKVMLEGRIAMPQHATAAVVMSSAPALADDRRDDRIIEELYEARIATIYAPLLTEEELQFDSRTGHFRHDAEFLAQRYLDIVQWLGRGRVLEHVPAGCVGTSGAAAGAIVAAAQRPDLVSAVVSIDGRTDLAVDHLRTLDVPTLLIVKDMPVLRMNREALVKIRHNRRLEIVHGTDCEAVECVVEKCVHWMQEKLAAVVMA